VMFKQKPSRRGCCATFKHSAGQRRWISVELYGSL